MFYWKEKGWKWDLEESLDTHIRIKKSIFIEHPVADKSLSLQ